MVSTLSTAALRLGRLNCCLLGRAPLRIAAAGGEVTRPAQGASRWGVASRTLLETLPRQCADEALAECGKTHTLDRGERFE
jgi:hypothetical protein